MIVLNQKSYLVISKCMFEKKLIFTEKFSFEEANFNTNLY